MGGRVSSPRLAGRGEELARLRDAVADARMGRPRLVLVSGEAGIGKSRLVAELVESLGPGDAHPLSGSCLAIADGGLPYAPLTEALRNLSRGLEPSELEVILGPARGELARLLPELAGPAAPGAGPAAPASRADQARLFELILGVLARLAADRPVVLIIEDLHWADDATRDLLTYLARNLRDERVAIIGTDRTDDPRAASRDTAWLPELLRTPAAERIELGPLTATEVADQLQGITGTVPSPGFAADMARRSGGNALFVEELVAAGLDGSARPDRAGAPAALPGTLREMLSVRTRGLEPDTAAVVRALAVAGRDVDDRLVVAATGLSADRASAAIHDAIGRHLVRVVGDPPVVGLRHALLREAVMAELLAGERRALHADFAGALVRHPELADRSPAGAAGELAQHWAAADRPVEAFTAALAAAASATEVRAHAEAARQRQRALDLLPRLPPEARASAPDEIDLLLAAEESADLAGDSVVAAELVERGLRLVDPALDPLRAATLESRRGYHAWLAGQSEDALARHRRAVELVPAEPPTLLRARVLRGLGGALMGLGRYRESETVCRAAIDAARAAEAPIEEGRALDMLGMDRVGVGDIVQGIEALEAACAIARTHDRGEGLVVGLHNLAYHLTLADRTEDALAAAREGIEAARAAGLERRYGINLRAVAADILLRLGDWDEADRLVGEGRALDPTGEGSLYLVILRIRLATARGQFEAGRAALEVGERLAEGDIDFDLAAYLHTASAELRSWSDQLDRAAEDVGRGLAALEGSDDVFLAAPLIALGCRIAADRAEVASAWRDLPALDRARADAGRLVALLDAAPGEPHRVAPATRGLAATAAWARAEARRSEGVSDPVAWRTLADDWVALGVPAAAAYARWRSAEARLTDREDRDAAAADLRAAAAAAAELGAAPLEWAVAALARRARIQLGPAPELPREPTAVPGPGTEPPASVSADEDPGRRRLADLGLSPREIQVLELVAAGRTNGEIADVLFISRKTVSVHVTHILAKLEVPSRIAAAALAVRLGLVDSLARPEVASEREPDVATRAFMFTDMVSSTALIEAIGDAAWTDLRTWHDATLRQLFEAHGGVEVSHAGDGFFVVFASAPPAIACAVAIQRALADHRRATGFAPAIRIGVHLGQATRTASGWAGREVHLAARIGARAGAGEILASAETVAAAGVRAPAPELVSLRGLTGTVAVTTVPWR